MSPAVKYTLARLGLFVAMILVLWPVPGLNVFIKLMIAVLVSAVLSWFLLRRMRDQVADQVEAAMARRREQKEQLRAALAGDELGSGGSAGAGSAASMTAAETDGALKGESAPKGESATGAGESRDDNGVR